MNPRIDWIWIAILSCLSCCNVSAGENQRPNVLFIAVDDLRPELNCYGATHIHSPNIDRLASGSLLFRNAYCQQSVCNPSRTSLMTGMRPDSIGVTGNHSHFRTKHPDVVTLPQHFKNHGYHAQAIGKIYHGVFPEGASKTKWDTMGDPESWSGPVTRFGPRYYYTENGIAAAKQAYRQAYKPRDAGPDDWTQKLVFGPATESPDVSDNTLYDGQVADAAIQALQELNRNPDQPFFLAVGFIKPHSPYVAPKKYFDKYLKVGIASDQRLPNGAPIYAGHGSGELRRYTDQPKKGAISDVKQQRVRQAYFACVSYVDAQIGRVLDELARLELADNTIVSLYGDHGYHLGEQGLWGKTTNFELDTRVPLIVRAPNLKAAGKTSDSLVELLDLYPTLAELAGLPLIDQLEGHSFVKLLDDPNHKTKHVALSQYPRAGGLMGYSMRTATHRLTQWVHLKSREVRATELYAYDAGKIETRNLAGEPEQKTLVTQLSKDLAEAFDLGLAGGQASSLQKSTRDNETSFENLKPGMFRTAHSQVGTWSATFGNVLVDDKHAKSGKHCLQLAGGDRSVVELEVAKGSKTDGQLMFWAERWTSRSPFAFRIEKQSGGKWTEIYNGDNQVKVGRAFLSKIVIPLGDPKIKRLRFSLNSPANTGILIDDLKIAPARPQRVANVDVVPMTLPALIGTPTSAILKLRVVAEGTLDPVSLTGVTAKLNAATDRKDIQSVQVFSSGSDSNFSRLTQFGSTLGSDDNLNFKGNQTLSDGENYFWIACTLDDQASIDHFVGAACSQLAFSNGETTQLEHQPSNQRMGVAVRKGGDDNVHTFRIPGLATTNQGTLIGVYDVRRRGGGDLPGDIDVGMSRSTDGGHTWEPMKIIMDMGDDPNFRFDGIGDPAVMVDKGKGTIWCSATWSHGNRSWLGSQPGLSPDETGQFMLVKSDDDGVTWSKPINITNQVKKPEWSFLLQGPGKGITLSDGTLVFPAQYQDPPDPNDRQANRLPHSTFIFSRDHGYSWNVATGAFDDTTEAQVIETIDGEIMINCRFNRQSKRVVMTTNDMGQTWKEHVTSRSALIEPGSCMASLINIGRELGGDNSDWILFSNPNSTQGRNRITIKASPDLGKTWPLQHQLLLDEQNGRGYSCLTMIDENTVGILYESSQADMAFQRIELAEIIKAGELSEENSLSFSRVFGDHMVLQANQPISVWGRAKPGSTIALSLGEARGSTTANSHGKWRVKLASQKPNAQPQSLTATSTDCSISISDVLIGEVWFCAGQSNMEWPVNQSADAKRAIQQSDDHQLRLFNFKGAARGSSGIYDQDLMDRLRPNEFGQGTWQRSGPDSASRFSAVGYYFAHRLRNELDCPIGMINVSIGGTPIESWITESALRSHAELANMLNGNWLDNPVLDDWCKSRARLNLKRGLRGELKMSGDQLGPNHSFKPGFMYQAGVAPFQPMAIKGVLWYQGESNADGRDRIAQYDAAFPLLVESWRQGFKNDMMPVAFVQLPAMGRPDWPVFRERQRRSLNQINHVGMAMTMDSGHPTNVHPKSKRPVGERLAQWVLVECYGRSGPAMGPLYKSKTTQDNKLVVHFDSVGAGLTVEGEVLRHFELAGLDGKFHAADAQVSKDKIILTSDTVPRPVHARYAWSPFPDPPVNLFNSIGIPASPFTTDPEF